MPHDDIEAIKERLDELHSMHAEWMQMRPTMERLVALLNGNGKPSIQTQLALLDAARLDQDRKIAECDKRVSQLVAGLWSLGAGLLVTIIGSVLAFVFAK